MCLFCYFIVCKNTHGGTQNSYIIKEKNYIIHILNDKLIVIIKPTIHVMSFLKLANNACRYEQWRVSWMRQF